MTMVLHAIGFLRGSIQKSFGISLLLLGLAACGGGGTDPMIEDMDGSGPSFGTYTEFSATTAGATSTLQTVAVQDGGALASLINGTLNHENNTISGGDLAGVMNAGRTTIQLTGGGTVTLTNLAQAEFVRVFDGTIGGENYFGVVGARTLGADVPGSGAGSATYNGVVALDLANADGIYVLTGDAQIIANWNGQNVATRFDGLSGTLNAENNGAISGVLQISGAGITNAGFSGGDITTQTGVFASADTGLSLLHAGGFYGVNADEVGGILVIDASDLDVSAVFVAE